MEFIAAHEQVFVVEQNRDGQLRNMLINEGNLDSNRVIAVLHYDGTPITARFIVAAIADRMALSNVTPIKKVAQ
jgi:2-oxoglutarate ferredoxin oxidoreductase subunit alpha